LYNLGALPKRRSKKIPCNLGRVETRSQLSPIKTPNLNICKVEIGHYNSSNYLQNNFRDMLDRELLTDCVIKVYISRVTQDSVWNLEYYDADKLKRSI